MPSYMVLIHTSIIVIILLTTMNNVSLIWSSCVQSGDITLFRVTLQHKPEHTLTAMSCQLSKSRGIRPGKCRLMALHKLAVKPLKIVEYPLIPEAGPFLLQLLHAPYFQNLFFSSPKIQPKRYQPTSTSTLAIDTEPLSSKTLISFIGKRVGHSYLISPCDF